MPRRLENCTRRAGKRVNAVFGGAARALCCHHRNRRQSQLRRSSRLPANGPRRGTHGQAFGLRPVERVKIAAPRACKHKDYPRMITTNAPTRVEPVTGKPKAAPLDVKERSTPSPKA